ncbi:FxsA family protein [Shewanella maritima]|uniref:FxsA family protein n=1 Tax=Shewanella maritima TaxID=2520507 RepID=UPI0037357592
MFFFLLLFFVVIPVIELNVLIRVGEAFGSWNTVALVFFTAIVGVSLVRSQGLSTLMIAQQKLASGEAPGKEIVEGMMLAAAGVMLLIPGFVTDFVGLILLTPFTRKPIASFLYKRLQLKVVSDARFTGGFGPHGQGPFQQGNPFDKQPPFGDQGNTFDGDFERKQDPSPRSHHIASPQKEPAQNDPAQKESDIIDVEVEPKTDSQDSKKQD